MNKVLIDSSVWISYFKAHKNSAVLNELIENNAICINDLILAELLPSILHKKEYELAELLNDITKYEITPDWDELQLFQLENIKRGNNNVGIPDLIIVQNSIQNKLKLFSCDKHFNIMSKYLPLELYTVG